jgi:hypothetical protein
VGDLGGSILTGIDGNPLAVLCTQLRIPQHHINSIDVKLYMSDGHQSISAIDSEVWLMMMIILIIITKITRFQSRD